MRRELLAAWIRRAQVRETVGALTLLALLLQASVPTGFMPAVDGSGFLKLCNGWTAEFRGETRDRAVHHAISFCPFAAAPTLGATPTFPSAPTTAVFIESFVTFQRTSQQVGPFGPPRVQSPRAPPDLNS